MKGKKCPVDVEWALDGLDNNLYIVQARSETIHSSKKIDFIEKYIINEKQNKKILIEGVSVGTKISQGKTTILHDIDIGIENNLFKKGDILVTDMTDPDWEPLMKLSSGIITNRGGRTCHAAIIARELGIPAIVGTNNGTKIIENNKEITLSCGEGETGYVYEGKIDFEIRKTKICLEKNNQLNTQLMMNIGNPENCFQSSMIPNEGVGLVRMEFIINNYIKVHPKALLDFSNNPNFEKDNLIIYNKIKKILGKKNYSGKQYFIDKLSNGIGRIAGSFYPKDVTVRFSDFKSNEYRNLLGGEMYEPIEENPMIGWRGASRYYSEEYKKAFELECIALKKVREEMGFQNVILMIPFCRTVEECKNVLKTMKEFGLERGKNNLKVYLMCEIPSNIILAEEFLELVDGYSIGTNDLTQLTLGLDRDSGLVSHIYNERNEAVKNERHAYGGKNYKDKIHKNEFKDVENSENSDSLFIFVEKWLERTPFLVSEDYNFWDQYKKAVKKMISMVINSCKKMNKKISVCGQAPSDFPEFAEFLVNEGINCMSLIPDTITPIREYLLEKFNNT